jgi:hypothetical protein
MDAIRAERAELQSLFKNAFTFYMAILLTKDIDMTQDNILLVVCYVAIIAMFLGWCKYIVSELYAKAKAEADHDMQTATHLSDLQPSMRTLMLVPLKWLEASLDIGTSVLVSKISVLMATIMQGLLPNSYNNNAETDGTMQLLPPIMLVGGFMFLCMYSVGDV